MLPFYNPILEKSKYRIGTISRVPSFNSNLYTFHYRSKTGSDSSPFVMLIQSARSGNAFFTAKNGQRYMLAINLNYITSPETRQLLINKLSGAGPITWKHALVIGKFFTRKSERTFGAANPGMMAPLKITPDNAHKLGAMSLAQNAAKYFIRQYDVRKLRDLSVVDATKYISESGFSG